MILSMQGGCWYPTRSHNPSHVRSIRTPATNSRPLPERPRGESAYPGQHGAAGMRRWG